MTLEKISHGKEAVDVGNNVISSVKNGFINLEKSAEAITDRVDKEDSMILDISSSSSFDSISKVTSEMSSINGQSSNLRKILEK